MLFFKKKSKNASLVKNSLECKLFKKKEKKKKKEKQTNEKKKQKKEKKKNELPTLKLNQLLRK